MRDAKRVKDYDFLLGEKINFKGKKYIIDGTWRVLGKESLYIALKHKNGWMNVHAPEVIKAYINERSYIIS
jgi:hypothetical protein